ncbi:Uncharacterized protein dnm_007850 [Desulfonema magnum]|uniref:Uncharacterized protein n=1 Tax=Desulfonema magnum TaxID=45655 RepID=A0A975BGD2_9BACT|nr:Uncharacterized protein dnm_007850 [Desulfonema magnum]
MKENLYLSVCYCQISGVFKCLLFTEHRDTQTLRHSMKTELYYEKAMP